MWGCYEGTCYDVILLQSLGVQHSDLKVPHTADCIEDDLITPELSLQHMPHVVLE